MDISNSHFINLLQPWLDNQLGVSIALATENPIPVYGSHPRQEDSCGLWAIRFGEKGIVTAQPQWVDMLKPIVAGLSPDELFSIFGAYELSRVTLPHGFGVWGPSWVLVGDGDVFNPVRDNRPLQLSTDELAKQVDHRVFWHCFSDQAMVGFGIFEKDRLVALAAVLAVNDYLWEIGVDVVHDAKGRGLGRAVVSAAGGWILSHKRLIYATTAPWNVPSARLLRSIGLQHVASIMAGMPAPLRVPPQPLGLPYPGAEIYNYYPDWASNKNIRSASSL